MDATSLTYEDVVMKFDCAISVSSTQRLDEVSKLNGSFEAFIDSL